MQLVDHQLVDLMPVETVMRSYELSNVSHELSNASHELSNVSHDIINSTLYMVKFWSGEIKNLENLVNSKPLVN